MVKMHIDVVEMDGFGLLRERADDYLRIMRTCDDDSVFLRPEWLQAWWREFGVGRKLRILEACESGALVGYAPLMVSRLGALVRARKLEFLATGPSDTLGMIVENGRKEVYDALVGAIRADDSWDIAELRDVKDPGSTSRAIRTGFSNPEVTTEKVPFIGIKGSFDEYLMSLSQNARHNLKRTGRKNRDELGVEFVRIDRPDDLLPALDQLLSLNELRWVSKVGETVFGDAQRRFLKDVVSRLSSTGIPVIHALTLRGEPISMCLGYEYGGRYLYYASGLDPKYSNYGPGRHLLAKIIEEAYRRKLTEVDLLRGGEDYKYRLGAVDRFNATFRITRPSIRGLLKGG